MDIDVKLKLFRSLIQNKSLLEVKKQTGPEGLETLLQIAKACNQQNSKALAEYLDKYLILASAGTKSFKISQAELKPEAFNTIQDILGPLLEEIEKSSSKEEKKERPKPKKGFRSLFGWSKDN